MEIKFLNIQAKKDTKKIKNFNLVINGEKTTGIYQDTSQIISSLLTNKISYDGNIYINDNELLDKKKVVYLDNLDNYTFLTKTVSDEFYLLRNKLSDLSNEDYLQKIISSLILVGMPEDFLKRDIITLSKSEERLLQIALSLILNPDIFIINEPFFNLDKKYIFKFKKILLELKRKYKKTIIIESLDINVLYELCDYLIIMKDNQLLIKDKMTNVFKDISFLLNNQIEIPNFIEFKNVASLYEVKLSNHKEINDLIKEVYRHAGKN